MHTSPEGLTPEGGDMGQEVIEQVSMQEFREKGAREFFESVPDIKEAFKQPIKRLCCMDEGVTEGLHAAGSGILMEREQLIKVIRDHNITEISTHEGCGAAAIAAQGKGAESPAEYARQWAKETAEAATRELGREIRYSGEYTFDQMERPADMHDAEIVYYDGTGRFNRKGVAVPSGFVVSRRVLDLESAQRDVQLAATIGHSVHGKDKGQGSYFTGQKRFIAVILGDSTNPEFSYEKLRGEVISSANRGPGNVAVDGFDVPAEWLD